MVTQDQLNQLLNFRSDGFPVISLYLNTDLRHTTLPEIRLITKDLLKEREADIANSILSHEHRESLKKDFKQILEFVENQLNPGGNRGQVIFACSGKNFWQVYPLPQRVKNALIIDPDFYIRPLMAILHQYNKYGLILVDRRRAQIFETYMGEIADYSHLITEDVPAKVRIAGWYGLEEKRVMRHIDFHIHQHLKKVINLISFLHSRDNLDYFIIGAPPDILPEFENHLPRYIQERIIERIHTEPFAWDINKIKQTALEIEQKFTFQRLNKMVDLLVTDAHKKERATLGLEKVLKAANMGNIRVLLIQENATFPGRECFNCGYLTINEENCPVCGHKTEPMADLYDEIVENTVHFNGEFYQVPKGTQLDQYEGIGAYLRANVEI